MGIACQPWDWKDGAYVEGPIYVQHRDQDGESLTVETDRGRYRNRMASDEILIQDIRQAVSGWCADDVIPGPEFGGVFRDVELLCGRGADPAWEGVFAPRARDERDCRDVILGHAEMTLISDLLTRFENQNAFEASP